jgi:hypothetical protein
MRFDEWSLPGGIPIFFPEGRKALQPQPAAARWPDTGETAMMLNRFTRLAIAAGVAAGIAIATNAAAVRQAVITSPDTARSVTHDQATATLASGYLISTGRSATEG